MKPHITKRNGVWVCSHGRGQSPIIAGIHPLTVLYNYNKVTYRYEIEHKRYNEHRKGIVEGMPLASCQISVTKNNKGA